MDHICISSSIFSCKNMWKTNFQMLIIPLLLNSLIFCNDVSADTAKKEGKVLLLEEHGDHTTASTYKRDVSEGMGNQLLDILDLDDPPKYKRSKREERMTKYMTDLYDKIEEEDQKQNCVDEHCALHEWVAADGIVSLSPEHVDILGSDVYKLRFSSSSVLSTESSPKSLIIAQLQLFITGHQVPVKIWVSNMENFDRSQVMLSPLKNHITMNISEIASVWLKPKAEPILYVRLDLDGQPATEPMKMETFVMVAFHEPFRPPIRPRNRRSSTAQTPSQSSTNSILRPSRRGFLSQNKESNPMDVCRKQALYVGFEELGWKEWLIAPEGFTTNFCGGECDFPLHNRMNATNHAIVQTLAHLVDPSRAQKAKCAPVQLSPMKILFIDNNRDVVMKKFRDMVVQECGCH